jgi:hypothetical protein
MTAWPCRFARKSGPPEVVIRVRSKPEIAAAISCGGVAALSKSAPDADVATNGELL